VVVAPVRDTLFADLSSRGRKLVALRALQLVSGLAGQLALLLRWSPHPETDAFLVLNAVPSLLVALLLVGGLDMALPGSYHRAARLGTEGRFLAQVAALTLLGGGVAAVAGAAAVAWGAGRLDLPPSLSAQMGVLLGGLALPSALLLLGRGLLIACDRLVAARGVLLLQSLLTAGGYALVRATPGVALSLATAGAAWGALLLTLYLLRGELAALRGELSAPSRLSGRFWHPELPRLSGALLSLGAAAALLHLQGLLERAAVLQLGDGEVAAFTVASRIWDAALALVVAGGVMPLYPRWARGEGEGPGLRWAGSRTLLLTLAAALVGGGAALGGGRWLEGATGWGSGLRTAGWVLLLLPRFILLATLQPLVLHHYARGRPWMPVLGAALGTGLLAACAPLSAVRWGRPGVAVVVAASVVPGWLLLGLDRRRRSGGCAF
jgi:hypothetical protein